jgi:hypothetical protein
MKVAKSIAPTPFAFPLADAARYSGLTVNMLRTLVWQRRIPAQLQGKKIIVLREDLENNLLQRSPIMEHSNAELILHLQERERRQVGRKAAK